MTTGQQQLDVPGAAPARASGPLLDIFVPGTPAPQGSKKAHAVYKGRGANREFTGKVSVSESSKKVKPWRADVRRAALDAWACPRSVGDPGAPTLGCCTGPLGETPHLRPPLDEALELRVEFVLYRPVATPKRTTPPATKYPDVSKLLRSTEDALTTAGVWRDDARVVEVHVSKRLAELEEPTGARIVVQRAIARRPGDRDEPERNLYRTTRLPIAFLVCAFRYALGRQTYMPSWVAEELIAHAQVLERWQREQIVRDIDSAIELGQAGAQCDVDAWSSVRSLFAEMNRPQGGGLDGG